MSDNYNGYNVGPDGTINSAYPKELIAIDPSKPGDLPQQTLVKTNDLPRLLVWLDIETSDLDRRHCFVLEVGCIITDTDLNERAAFHEIENKHILGPAIARMDEKVLKMHTDSGLLAEIEKNDAPHERRSRLTDATPNSSLHTAGGGFVALLDFLKLNIPEPENTSAGDRRGLLCGSSVHFDKDILREHAPFILDHLHYRILDVSVIKEACRLWAPSLALPKAEHIAHRALADIRASIAEMRLYRDTVFMPAAVIDILGIGEQINSHIP
jgi:oligoribonuclease